MDAVLRCKLHFPYKLPILVDRFSPPKKTEVYVSITAVKLASYSFRVWMVTTPLGLYICGNDND